MPAIGIGISPFLSRAGGSSGPPVPVPIGTLVHNDFGGSFSVAGTPGQTFGPSSIELNPGPGAIFSVSNFVYYNDYITAGEGRIVTATFTPDATCEGASINWQLGTGTAFMTAILSTSAGLYGNGIMYLINGPSTIVATIPITIPIVAGRSYKLILENTVDRWIMSWQCVTPGFLYSSATAECLYQFSVSSLTELPVYRLAGNSKFGMATFGGKATFTDFSIASTQLTQGILCIVDSKGAAFYPGTQANMWVQQVRDANPGVNIYIDGFAGGNSTEAVARLADFLLYVAAEVWICVGRNDSSPTASLANYAILLPALQNIGCKVKYIYSFPENATDQNLLNTAVVGSGLSFDKLVPVNGLVDPAQLPAYRPYAAEIDVDMYHQNPTGHIHTGALLAGEPGT
jgi:hypothetical protein